ncbi:MAG: GNAT family N-acetyltransferase [Corynebacterium sp.]|nr:GNAT family N-acetyltransferase [Corynebacterium sp.]
MVHEIVHNEKRQRFSIAVDGQNAGFAAYSTPREGVRDFNHTVINPDFRGKGLSKVLIKAVLDDTRNSGMAAVASCSAVAEFIEKNPDYKELLGS